MISLAEVSENFNAPGANRGPAAATLRILSGPDVGQEFALPSGTSYIGRDRDVDIRLSDPLTSKRHARITVGESVEIVDTNSANGLLMDGLPVTRATLNSSDTVTLGETTVTVVPLGHNHAAAPTSPLVDFNRSPRVVPRFDAPKRVPPAGPKRPDHQAFPYIMLMAPLLMGGVMSSAIVSAILFSRRSSSSSSAGPWPPSGRTSLNCSTWNGRCACRRRPR